MRSSTRPQGVSVLIEDDLGATRIPRFVRDLASFRRWAVSDDFPERGRIDFLGGEIEIDMSPEDLWTHGSPKTTISIALGQEVERRDLGWLWIDRARISNEAADLSCEPDILFLSWKTLESGRVTLVEKSGKEGRYVEILGSADLVVEIVSDSSVTKDTERLRARYESAGVREYWIVDARGREISFVVLARKGRRFAPVRADRQGFLRSSVLERKVKLTRSPARLGFFRYRLAIEPLSTRR